MQKLMGTTKTHLNVSRRFGNRIGIKDFDLPLLDEPVPPSMGQYSKPHINTLRTSLLLRRIKPDRRRFYAKAYAQPGGMCAGFEYFHTFEKDAKDFVQLSATSLTMPVHWLGPLA